MGARRNPSALKEAPRWSAPGWLSRRLLGALVLFGGLGALLAFGGWRLAQPDTLPIRAVQIKGEFRHLDEAELYAVLGRPASGGFFNVEVRAVKQAAESLPWVDRASVRRIWPDTLRVTIHEQVPLARWRRADGGQVLVNVRGELFAAAGAESLAQLPLFYGPEGAAESVAKRYQALSAPLASLGLAVGELGFDQRRAWGLVLDNGVHLLLGRAVDGAALGRFIVAWPRALATRAAEIEQVDLRYTNGFAVRWKQAVALG